MAPNREFPFGNVAIRCSGHLRRCSCVHCIL
jgi:hypothetical protein